MIMLDQKKKINRSVKNHFCNFAVIGEREA